MRDWKKREGLLPKPLYTAQQLIDWEWRLRDEYGVWVDKKREEGMKLDRKWETLCKWENNVNKWEQDLNGRESSNKEWETKLCERDAEITKRELQSRSDVHLYQRDVRREMKVN